MKFKNIILSGVTVLLVILLSTGQMSAAIVPNNLEEGDEFTFSIDTLSITNEVNGTDFAELQPYREGDQLEVTVDEISEQSGNTVIDVSETLGDNVKKVDTTIDEWADYIFGGLFLASIYVGNFPATDFSEPNFSSNTDETFIPYFATSNVTYYEEEDSEFETYDDTFVDEEEKYDSLEANSNADYNADESTFTLSFSLDWAGSNTTEEATFNLSFKYDIEIDVSRSVITKFSYIIDSTVTVGEATKTLGFSVVVTEGGNFLANLPAPGLYISILSLFFIVHVINRRD